MLPLEGIKVLEFAEVWAGPGAGMYLADHGASVIKVEPPDGDHSRHIYSTPTIGLMSRAFVAINRNKRAITLDLRKREGREIAQRLAKEADVVLASARDKALVQMGIDYETLRRLNPRLIYTHVTAFGKKGSYAGRPGYDLMSRALTGILGQNRLPDGRPFITSLNVADLSAGMLLAYGITLALFARERTGRGQLVETSLLASSIAMQASQVVNVVNDKTPKAQSGGAFVGTYRCQDGEYLAMIIAENPQWLSLCKALDLPELATDERFSTIPGRYQHRDALYDLLDGIFGTKSRMEWAAILQAADIAAAPVLNGNEVFQEKQLWDNEILVEVEDPNIGPVQMLGVPVRLSEATYRHPRPAPTPGQHTDEVLAELGFSADDITHLRANKVAY